MLKAGSLLYAIYVCLIIAILSGGLIYIFTINKTLATRQSVNEQLIDRCDSCFNYVLSNPEKLKSKASEKIDLFDDGLLCDFETERWGMYSKLLGKAFFKKNTIQNSYLVGRTSGKKLVALYLCDFGEELKISGSTEIKGDVVLPKKRYKTVNILGNLQANNPKLQGNISVSSQNLPKIISTELIFPKNTTETTLDNIKDKDLVFRGFDERTMVVYLGKRESLDRMRIKGNFIVTSNDTIRINNTSKIEDIIVKAPKVIIEEGFEGSLQIFADKEVEIESEVKLRYPSSIVIGASFRDYDKKITIGEDSEIYGGLVIDGSSFREKQNNYVSIAENSLIIGDIYCNGILELKGKVMGSVYTHKLQLETKSSKYADVILNGIINAEELPKDFVRLPLFADIENQKFERIKNIQ